MKSKMISEDCQDKLAPEAVESLEVQVLELMRKVEEIENGKKSLETLETLLEIVTEHSTYIENQIHEKNHEMQSYIQQVQKVTKAAIALKNDTFQPQSLVDVADRDDELGELAQVFTHMVETVKTREQELVNLNRHLKDLVHAYERFVPNEFLKFLHKQSIVDVHLGDYVSKEMAVMFSDIRSFTSLSEKMTPQETFNFINTYLGRVSPEIRNHNGFIVKYLGDGMMAVFPDGVDYAVQAGIAQSQQVQKYNQERIIEGYSPLNVGIGIHVGHMMVGMVGEVNRIEGDALSSNVTLTARLEGLTKYYGITLLISEEVLQRLHYPEQYQIRFLDRVIVQGRTEPIAVHEVLNAEVEPTRTLKIQTLALFAQGQQHYRQANFDQAKTLFEQVLEINPQDKTTQLYLGRTQQFLEKGVPDDWCAVWRFNQK